MCVLNGIPTDLPSFIGFVSFQSYLMCVDWHRIGLFLSHDPCSVAILILLRHMTPVLVAGLRVIRFIELGVDSSDITWRRQGAAATSKLHQDYHSKSHPD